MHYEIVELPRTIVDFGPTVTRPTTRPKRLVIICQWVAVLHG